MCNAVKVKLKSVRTVYLDIRKTVDTWGSKMQTHAAFSTTGDGSRPLASRDE